VENCPVCGVALKDVGYTGGDPDQTVRRCPNGHGRYEGAMRYFHSTNLPDTVVPGRGWVHMKGTSQRDDSQTIEES